MAETITKHQARVALGLAQEDRTTVALEHLSQEQLILKLELLRLSLNDTKAAHAASVETYRRRLKDARSGQKQANRRADAAEAKLRAITQALAT